jgi:hypothetical protein
MRQTDEQIETVISEIRAAKARGPISERQAYALELHEREQRNRAKAVQS